MRKPVSGAYVVDTAPTGIIVCADDFAFNQSVSLGISQLARLGCISATGAMVLSPRWGQDVTLLQDLRDQVDVGLHLDWTSDFALAAGHGLPLGAAMRRALVGGFDRGQATTVIERQLDLFEAQWCAVPDFVDGHQHVQQFAGIREALLAVLTRRYGTLPTKPYLRISRAVAGLVSLKGRVIGWMGAGDLEKLAQSANIKSAGCLFGIYDFNAKPEHYAKLMAHWLAQASVGSILMCHPAQAAQPEDKIGEARAQEFAYLGGPAFAAALRQANVRLVRGRAVLGQDGAHSKI